MPAKRSRCERAPCLPFDDDQGIGSDQGTNRNGPVGKGADKAAQALDDGCRTHVAVASAQALPMAIFGQGARRPGEVVIREGDEEASNHGFR